MHAHAAILHFAPILGAEKSKTPFYIAGGVLVAWALLVSVVLGMRQGDFPRTAGLQRLIMAVSAVLVALAVSMAVVTSGGSTAAKASAAPAPSGPSAPAPSPETSTPTQGTTTSPSTPSRGTSPAKRPGAAPAAASTALSEAADPSGQLRFVAPQLSAKAGTVTVKFTNGSPLPHNFTLAQGATIVGHTPTFQGGAQTLTLKLKAGTYKFFCTVPGHREAGMEGTLVVS